MHPVSRYQLVRHLLELAQDDPQLRTSLPMGVDLADPAVLAAELADTVAALHPRLDAISAATWRGASAPTSCAAPGPSRWYRSRSSPPPMR